MMQNTITRNELESGQKSGIHTLDDFLVGYKKVNPDIQKPGIRFFLDKHIAETRDYSHHA